jgi:hypothetical protein
VQQPPLDPLLSAQIEISHLEVNLTEDCGAAVCDSVKMPRPFNPLLILTVASVAIVCTCAAYDVGVGHVWGTVRQAAGIRIGEEVMVEAGQQLSVAGRSATLENLSPGEVNDRLAWAQEISPKTEEAILLVKDGWIAFQGQTLESVAAEFNRHNVRQLVIGDQTTGHIRVGGKFRTTDIEGFVAALGVTHGIKAVREPSADERPEQIFLQGRRAAGPASAQTAGPHEKAFREH